MPATRRTVLIPLIGTPLSLVVPRGAAMAFDANRGCCLVRAGDGAAQPVVVRNRSGNLPGNILGSRGALPRVPATGGLAAAVAGGFAALALSAVVYRLQAAARPQFLASYPSPPARAAVPALPAADVARVLVPAVAAVIAPSHE